MRFGKARKRSTLNKNLTKKIPQSVEFVNKIQKIVKNLPMK